MASLFDYAQSLNAARDGSLLSGFEANKRWKDDYLSSYRMPEYLRQSDYNSKIYDLNNAYLNLAGEDIVASNLYGIKNQRLLNNLDNDYLKGNYDRLLNTKSNRTKVANEISLKEVEKVDAENVINRLERDAINRGMKSEVEIYEDMVNHLKGSGHLQNPTLVRTLNNRGRAIYGNQFQLGVALGGTAGQNISSEAAGNSGLSFAYDQHGQAYMFDKEGNPTSRIPADELPYLVNAANGDPSGLINYRNAKNKLMYESQAQQQAALNKSALDAINNTNRFIQGEVARQNDYQNKKDLMYLQQAYELKKEANKNSAGNGVPSPVTATGNTPSFFSNTPLNPINTNAINTPNTVTQSAPQTVDNTTLIENINQKERENSELQKRYQQLFNIPNPTKEQDRERVLLAKEIIKNKELIRQLKNALNNQAPSYLDRGYGTY